MASTTYDIAVAGCGTAGMAAALLLARDGHRITLFERFDMPRPVGSGLMLQPTGLAVLDALVLAKDARRLGARIDRLHGEAGGRIVLDVRYEALRGAGLHAIGIHRGTLFDLLFNATAQAGIPIDTNREVAAAQDRRLMFADGSSAGPFDLIVDALGTRTPLAAPCGRDLAFGALWANVAAPAAPPLPDALVQRYRRADVMAGLMPIGRLAADAPQESAFFWSLRACDYAGWKAAGLEGWKSVVVDLWPQMAPVVAQIESADRLTFARYAHRIAPRPVSGRVVHIGDSWHSTSPQLGQGANMALLDAYALAAGLRAGADLDAGVARAVAMRRGHVRLYQGLSRLLTPVYQSNGRALPWLRDRVMAPVSRLWPFPRLQATLVSGLILDPLGRLELGLAAPEAAR